MTLRGKEGRSFAKGRGLFGLPQFVTGFFGWIIKQ
jgi:hypothetical protein